MNTQPTASSAQPAMPIAPIAPNALPVPRPLYWSVRREVWENRSIYIAPLAAAAVVLFGSFVSFVVMAHRTRFPRALDEAQRQAALERPFSVTAALIIFTSFVVGVFYCLDALHGERRDRSILFWKSLPVSDRTTVLAKACIPLVVQPMITFAIIVSTQLVLLVMSTPILAAYGLSASTLWAQWPLFQKSLMLLYALAALALWHAPVYAWLLMVSGWARRMAFLWAVLPLVAINVVEKIVFNTHYFLDFQKRRLFGGFLEGFIMPARDKVAGAAPVRIDPGTFLSLPGLWIGLAFAAVFLVAAVELRRNREPI